MANSIHERVRTVMEETNSAYHVFSEYNPMNGDFANFASMALSQFKNALRDPKLTRTDLESLLRRGMKTHRLADPDTCWTTFMANYIAHAANTDAGLEAAE